MLQSTLQLETRINPFSYSTSTNIMTSTPKWIFSYNFRNLWSEIIIISFSNSHYKICQICTKCVRLAQNLVCSIRIDKILNEWNVNIEWFLYPVSTNSMASSPKGHVAVSSQRFCLLTWNLLCTMAGTSCQPHKDFVTAPPSCKTLKVNICSNFSKSDHLTCPKYFPLGHGWAWPHNCCLQLYLYFVLICELS